MPAVWPSEGTSGGGVDEATVVGMSGVLSAMLAVSTPAWAHVVVSPEVVTAGDYETLTVSVPTEKEIPTTKIRVEVPEGFLLSGCSPCRMGAQFRGGRRCCEGCDLLWRGDTLSEFQQFLLQAQAPDKPGEYPWKAIQTYKDGSVAEWTGPPIPRARLCDRGSLRWI